MTPLLPLVEEDPKVYNNADWAEEAIKYKKLEKNILFWAALIQFLPQSNPQDPQKFTQ